MSYGILSQLRDEDQPDIQELTVAKKKMDLDQRLAKAFKSHLSEAKEGAKAGGFEEFDDGRYKARLIKCEVGESGNGRLQLAMHWKFRDGDYKGKTKIAYQGLETEDNLKFLFRDLNKLGYETDEIDGPADLKGIVKELNKEKPEAVITLKTKGEFQNVNIAKVGGSDEDEDADDEDTDAESDEEDDEDEDTPKKKGKKKKASDDDDDDDDSDDEDEEEEKPKKKKKPADDDDDDDSDDEDESEDDDEEEEKPKKKGKKKPAGDDDDDEDEEESDDDDGGEDVELTVGSDVTYKFKGKKAKGTVLDIMPKTNEFRVETDGKKRKVSIDNIVDVEVPEEPKRKKKK